MNCGTALHAVLAQSYRGQSPTPAHRLGTYGCRAYSNRARNLVTKLSSVGVVGFGRYALCDVCAVRCALCFLFCVL